MDELNRKLAEWAGFKLDLWDGKAYWVTPDGFPGSSVPDFTHSLDACFKWLVPKLKGLCYLDFTYQQELMCEISGDDWLYDAEGETPALALCKAIEKMIDGSR